MESSQSEELIRWNNLLRLEEQEAKLPQSLEKKDAYLDQSANLSLKC